MDKITVTPTTRLLIMYAAPYLLIASLAYVNPRPIFESWDAASAKLFRALSGMALLNFVNSIAVKDGNNLDRPLAAATSTGNRTRRSGRDRANAKANSAEN